MHIHKTRSPIEKEKRRKGEKLSAFLLLLSHLILELRACLFTNYDFIIMDTIVILFEPHITQMLAL